MESTCRNCGAATQLVSHSNGPEVLGCPLCGAFEFVGPVSNLPDLYDHEYYHGSEYINYELGAPVYKRNLIRKLRAISARVPELPLSEMRVLELGCATGDFMQVLKEEGVAHSLGVEVSEYSRRRATERGFKVLDPCAADYTDCVREFAPNIICAWDVWEHLERPADTFRTLLEHNPSVQIVSLTTLDSSALVPRLRGKKWRLYHPPTHLNFPTRASFEAYFPRVSFEVLGIDSFGYYRPLADYLAVFLPLAWINRMPKLFRIPLYLNLFDCQLVIARRAK